MAWSCLMWTRPRRFRASRPRLRAHRYRSSERAHHGLLYWPGALAAEWDRRPSNWVSCPSGAIVWLWRTGFRCRRGSGGKLQAFRLKPPPALGGHLLQRSVLCHRFLPMSRRCRRCNALALFYRRLLSESHGWGLMASSMRGQRR